MASWATKVRQARRILGEVNSGFRGIRQGEARLVDEVRRTHEAFVAYSEWIWIALGCPGVESRQ